jgi:hypothetical protein
MATRRHDAHTTQTPQAMVPAQVLPRVRCAQCGFIFFGTPGNRCEICRAADVPHEAAASPDSPTTDAEASALITQALDALPASRERWRQDLETTLAQVEEKAQTLLEDVGRLRQTVRHILDAEGGKR